MKGQTIWASCKLWQTTCITVEGLYRCSANLKLNDYQSQEVGEMIALTNHVQVSFTQLLMLPSCIRTDEYISNCLSKNKWLLALSHANFTRSHNDIAIKIVLYSICHPYYELISYSKVPWPFWSRRDISGYSNALISTCYSRLERNTSSQHVWAR